MIVNKLQTMVGVLQKLVNSGSANVDDVSQVYNDISNTMANLLAVRLIS
jgi:hypothetical protein